MLSLPSVSVIFQALPVWFVVKYILLKNEEYCNACRVIGVSNTRLLFTHILPNAISPIIVYATLNVASAIISEAALSFLGLGIAAPTASWGSILREGKEQFDNRTVCGNNLRCIYLDHCTWL